MLLRPGKTCDEALELLKNVTEQGLNDVQNSIPHLPPGGSGNALHRTEQIKAMHAAVNPYDQWTLAATKKLLEVFADRSIPARMRGERYSSIVFGDHTADRLSQLLNRELNELRTYFMELGNELYRLKEKYAHHQGGRTLVLDTNDLLHYSRYDKIPWAAVYGKNAVVVIPHVVVDEIDKKSYATSDSIRKRARGVFGLLEQTLTDQRDGHAMAGGVRVEVLLDEPQHVRLPNNDDEIVARACELQQAIGPVQVTVLTGDNGMRARALAWGLNADKLPAKYRIEQVSTGDRAEYLQSITALEEQPPALTPG
ncbi:PIN domain-containing protein [Streptomyces luridiscabiei]|uniref:PIN domain-containing protein n=1 Tax=Streptomyces luridiscabiei TaxID=164114 RepID=UPI00099E3F1C|nr:PIN domain-containing protein [Streptomyces luridiscabiei]